MSFNTSNLVSLILDRYISPRDQTKPKKGVEFSYLYGFTECLNSVDSDQLASSDASWSGSTLFPKK